MKDIPLPESLHYHWLLGHIPAMYDQNEKELMESVEEVNKPANRDKVIRRVCLGFLTYIDITHPDYLVDILKEPKTLDIYGVLKPWLGDGLLIAEGNKWFRNRKLLTPAFHCEILKGYVPVYNSCVSVLIKKWVASVQENNPVLLFESLSSMSLDIILQSAFSYKSNCQQVSVQTPYVQACSKLVYLVTDRVVNPLYMIDSIYWYTPHGKKTKELCQLVHNHAETVILERRQALTDNSETKSPRTKRSYLDFLDILLIAKDEEGRGMSDLEIRNEVDTFMFEGHDTTTSGMSWTLYCLAQHPEHQEKIREEVRSVLKDRECLEYEDLKHLHYTTWCIKEAMRLYPPVFAHFRKTTQEIRIKEKIIPSDTVVRINTFNIHRNIAVWENPDKYYPLRFKPANLEKHGPYDYIPFSAGSRNCIGQNFAMNEMRVVVGTIVKTFKLKMQEGHHVEMVPRVVLRTKNDIQMSLTLID